MACPPVRRGPLAVALGALALAASMLGWRHRDDARLAWQRCCGHPRVTAPAVVLIVLDTVRADHLHACGYSRPTSPHLDALAATGSLHCAAYSPGSWTLPGHASLFTGLSVPEHGADATTGSGSVDFPGDQSVRPLAEGFETVAERFATRGYQTAAFSENPVLADWSGLAQGFGTRWVSPRFDPGKTHRLLERLETWLAVEADPTRPLFLFANLSEAHTPLDTVPSGVDWLPPRPGLTCQTDRSQPCYRFQRGEMGADEAKAYREWQVDSYDWGIARADETLGRVLELLRIYGWFGPGTRLVVVADHGELLGEHGIVGHDEYLWEPVVRVPLLTVGTLGPPTAAPVSTRIVPDLLLRGHPPETPLPVESVGNPMGFRERMTDGRVPAVQSVARWDADRKLLWTADQLHAYDLASDPAEERPIAAEADTALDHLRASNVARFRDEVGGSEAGTDALRSLGYME